MTGTKTLVTILIWGVAFAILGVAVGATIGVVAPEYYRMVFRDGESPNFNPMQVGIGLGATQGLIAGIVLAIGMLGLKAWRDIRAESSKCGGNPPSEKKESRRWSRIALWGVLTGIPVILVATVSFLLGAVIGQQKQYHIRTEQKLETIATILEGGEFPGIESSYSSAAKVYLKGTTKDSQTRDALRDRLIEAFGTQEAEFMLHLVEVAK